MSDLARRLGGVLRSAQDKTLGRRAVKAGLLTEAELTGPFGVDELLQMKGVAPELIKELRDDIDREDFALFRPDRAMPAEVLEVLAEPDRRMAEFIRVSRLGQGGIGEVWKAWDSRLGRWVALKLPMATPDQEGAAERFSREALAAARLTHSNIVSIHRVAEENGRCFIVMQYVEGPTLRASKLDSRKAIQVLRDVALAVHYAHEQGVIHRDLKPGNIVIGLEGRPFVLDFGLAHLQQAGRVQSREGLVAGTAAYMSPEQARGESAARERATDVYSLGATLYEVVTGQPPFDGASFADILEKVLHREPKPPRSIVPTLSLDVETVILKAMDKDPKRRYATAKEFADELDRCLRDEPVLARRTAFSRRMRVGMRQNPWLGWVGAGLVLAVVGAGAWRSVSESNAAAAARRERDREIKSAADLARLSIDAMLTLRRAGANEGMKEFLARIEEAHAAARAKDLMTAELECLLGRAYRVAMMNPKALECQDRALVIAPNYGPALYEQTVLLIQEPVRATRLAQQLPKAVQGLGESLDALTLRGFLGNVLGNPQAARQDLEKVVAADPVRVEAWDYLAQTHAAAVASLTPPKERVETARQAEAVLTRALKHDRGYAVFWTARAEWRKKLAGLLQDTGQDPALTFQGAEDDISQAIRLQPTLGTLVARAEIRTLQASWRASLGGNPEKSYEEAAADLDQAALLKPGDVSVLIGRSFTFRSRADYKTGRGESPLKDLEELEAQIADYSKHGTVPPEAWMNYALTWAAQALYRGGLGEDPTSDFARAEEAFDKIKEPCAADWKEKRARMRVQRARLRPRQQSDPAMKDIDLALQDLSAQSSIQIPHMQFGITRAMARRTKGTLMIACGQDPTEVFQGARSDLDQVLNSNPVAAEASAERGHLELAWGRYRTKLVDRRGALEHYNCAVQSFEEAIRCNDNLATPLREWLREARRGVYGAY
ncbi:MAG: serine/threonine protein kinase [Planctomycetaceae bacterium]|nr:serine/threonine protein kinase [Planctomycetaceae bacterium]